MSSGEIVQYDRSKLLAAESPKEVIQQGTEIANALATIINQQKLYTTIGKKKYVQVEGWIAMGVLFKTNVLPFVEYSRRLDRATEVAYEARVTLKTMDGMVVSAGEAICSSEEKNWKDRDEFAIKSMAQTRATGKAFRLAFSWIMALGGYEGTPAEEMSGDEKSARKASDKQITRLIAIQHASGYTDDEFKPILLKKWGLRSRKLITLEHYDEICKWLENNRKEAKVKEDSQDNGKSEDKMQSKTLKEARKGMLRKQINEVCQEIMTAYEGEVENPGESMQRLFDGVLGLIGTDNVKTATNEQLEQILNALRVDLRMLRDANAQTE